MSKLDDRNGKYVFIGYDENSKGYKLFNPRSKKIIISKDIEFDEGASWDWSSQTEESYDFFPYFEEEISTNEVIQRQDSPRSTPPQFPQGASSLSSSPCSSWSLGVNEGRKYRSLVDIYNETKRLDDASLFCLYANHEPVSFEEAIMDERWIQAIERNETWELATLQKRHKVIEVNGCLNWRRM